ncbi:MAG TPA: valine--tRNA ligase, partial [Nocardioides sp.]
HASWPTVVELGSAAATDAATLEAVSAALIGIRGAKSNAKVSMRAELSRVEIRGPQAQVFAAEQAADDLRKTGKITGDLVFTVDDSATELSVDAELAPTE